MKTHHFLNLRRGLLGIALAGASLATHAAVLLEQQFASGLGAFSATGSVSLVSDGARLRGGSAPGRLTSPTLNTTGYSGLVLSVNRATSGLDLGETAVLTAVVNGTTRTLESTRSASGTSTFTLGDGVTSVNLQFAVNASSTLETYTITSVKLEGTATGGGCEPNCNPGSAKTIVPDASWTCGLPGGIPDPTGGTPVFTGTLARGTALAVGNTPYGSRRVTPNSGGSVTGQRVSGTIQGGSIDFDLTLPSGAVEHESRYVLRSSTGTLVYMRSCGVADGSDVRFVADFEAPSSSSLQWLNSGTYVGKRRTTANGVEVSVYAVSATPNPAHPVVRVPADASLRQQAWNCSYPPATATQGTQVLSASVNIGSSQSVGSSKSGSRNIIPITGGSLSGTLVPGSVNAGGADYQLNPGGGLQIEARYTLKASNGETIVVRNCGNFAIGDLTQVMFEARTDGAYAALNNRSFVGTITPGLGRVTIRVYDQR
ncbi:MAG: DUF3237 family protein [Rhizobacter sp.]